MSAATVLDVRDVHFAYEKGAAVLRGASFQLAAGDLALLWGLNGAGKTTLGKIIAGLLKPARGVVRAPAGARPTLVLAQPERMILGETPSADVRLGPALKKLPAAAVEEKTRDALAAVGLTDRATTPCDELSLGERKRVALAAALALEPSTLVLDEPFAFLDDAQVAAYWTALGALAAGGTAILVLSGRRDAGAPYRRRLELAAGVVSEPAADSA